jgi:hypothetical protein
MPNDKLAAAREAHKAFQHADDLWSAELRRTFGKDACNRRYDYDDSAHPPRCRELRAAFHSAGDAWRMAVKDARES